jgi:hypothetical protein
MRPSSQPTRRPTSPTGQPTRQPSTSPTKPFSFAPVTQPALNVAVILYVTQTVGGVAAADVASPKALYRFQLAVTSALARALNLYAAGGSMTPPVLATANGKRARSRQLEEWYGGDGDGDGGEGVTGVLRRLLAPSGVTVTYTGTGAPATCPHSSSLHSQWCLLLAFLACHQ